MTQWPRTEREARGRSERKLKAIERHARRHLLEVAAFWDEGQVTSQIDITLENLSRDVDAIRHCMNEEIRAHEEDGEPE